MKAYLVDFYTQSNVYYLYLVKESRFLKYEVLMERLPKFFKSHIKYKAFQNKLARSMIFILKCILA